MPAEQFIVNILQVVPLLILKILVIILLLLHTLFSLVLVRQTKIMIRVVEAQISPAIYMISIIHSLVSLFVLGWTIVFL